MSANSLLVIINDILDLSKIESGKLSLDAVDFPIVPCIYATRDLLKESAEIKGLKLEYIIADDVPLMINADPGRIRQILINLLGNAIKFTDSGVITVGVSVLERADEYAMVLFEVSDTGIGIAAAAQKLIFDDFSQADISTTRRFGGTGLGLSVSSQLVKLMGGAIGVESTLGEGARFWFSLPLKLSTEDVILEQAKVECASVTTYDNSRTIRKKYNASVLVAEDGEVNQLVIAGIMGIFDCNPIVVDNGAAAVEVFSNRQMDIIFMDIQMPEMDGVEATAKIRELEKSSRSADRIPIIALTANAMEGARDKYLNAGMDDYLTKPIDIEEFSSVMEKWIGHLAVSTDNNNLRDAK